VSNCKIVRRRNINENYRCKLSSFVTELTLISDHVIADSIENNLPLAILRLINIQWNIFSRLILDYL
jgi:hypothetical protein